MDSQREMHSGKLGICGNEKKKDKQGPVLIAHRDPNSSFGDLLLSKDISFCVLGLEPISLTLLDLVLYFFIIIFFFIWTPYYSGTLGIRDYAISTSITLEPTAVPATQSNDMI